MTTSPLNLTPQDWQIATWRPFTPLPRPATRPFDWPTLLAEYERTIQRKGKFAWSWSWSKAPIDWGMSRQEAHFWVDSLILAASQSRRQEALTILRKPPADRYTGDPQWDDLWADIQNNRVILSDKILIPLLILFPVFRLIPLLEMQYLNFLYQFRDNLLPYLTIDERESMRGVLRSRLPHMPWPNAKSTRPSPLHLIAAYFGLHEELYQGILTWNDDEFGRNPHRSQNLHRIRPQELIMGLGDPAAVVAQMSRLNLPLRTAAHVGGWLAHTELSQLDFISNSIVTCRRATWSKAMTAKVGDATHSPETAVVMMTAMHDSLAPQNGRSWLEAHPEQAATGLLTLAQERTKLGQATRHFLRDLNRAGHEPLLRQSAGDALYDTLINAGLSDNAWFDEATTPEWLREGMANILSTTRTTLPDWLKLSDLPAIEIGDYALNDDQKTAVLLTLLQPNPTFLNSLREKADPLSLDGFVWALLDVWQYQNIGARGKWVFNGLAYLGNDSLLVQLNQQLRDWGTRKKDNWVQLGLDCLQQNGSDTALLQLYHLSQSFSRKKLRGMADQAINNVAKQRRISEAELGDRMVPDCGLDKDGRLSLDFGPRQFTFVMGPDMTPRLRDDQGKLRKSLPAPRVNDDPDRVAEARREWATFKKQLSKVLKVQTARLEEALILERRWTQVEFERYFLHHPLLRHFAQFWVWGVFGEQVVLEETVVETAVPGTQEADSIPAPDAPTLLTEDIREGMQAVWSAVKLLFKPRRQSQRPAKTTGKQSKAATIPATIKRVLRTERKQATQLLISFRMTADLSFANQHDDMIDNPFAGIENGRVGLVHPVHLRPEDQTAWSHILHDYEIVPPFAQIDRPQYQHSLTPQEIEANTITRFDGIPRHVLSLRGKLNQVGWQAGRRSARRYFERYFPQIDITAVAEIRENAGSNPLTQEQSIRSCYFVQGQTKRQDPTKLTKLPLTTLSPLILSEVLHGLTKATQS